MKPKAIYLISGLFFTVIIGMIVFTYVARQAINEEVPTTPQPDPIATTNPYNIDRIDAKHFYRDGVHTIVGSLFMPTPCDLLEGEARVAESMPEQVTFAFSVINTSEMCAQVVTEQRFRIDATASDQAALTATFMNQPVILNLVSAGADESPDDFELFIKG